MLPKLLLIVLTLLMAPTDVIARGDIWRQKRVVVYDYSGSAWSPYVRDAVNRYNEMLPMHAPTLVYTAVSGPCRTHKRAISVCVVPLSEFENVGTPGDPPLGEAPYMAKHGKMRWALIRLGDFLPPHLLAPCHELAHAMGQIKHGAWTLVQPCPYDAAAMKRLYRARR